ncbi:MAG: LytTR family DNA-binding domain-containing protein [Lachnospiraceae bacterium]|nr:LytTR family DNA-binding domain-containing protein [Lachnospiraceae bacterium]
MINIAIVDDNTAFLQEMKRDIEACKEFTADMVCDTYCSGADFLQADCGACQLVILDMQMAGMGGYETAQKLREQNENVVIAFVSGVVLPEPEHFRVQPYRYLLKSADADERIRDIEELLLETKRRSRGEMVEVTSDGEAQRVSVGSILYIEKTKRGSRLTVEAGAAAGRKTLQSNERLEEWYAQLCAQGFEYAHTSYIVNLKAVTKIMQNELMMSNGDKLGISRTCSKKFHQSFSMYFHKKYKRGAKE